MFSSKDKNFSGKNPEDHRDGLSVLIIARNGNVDKLETAISIAKSNNRDVHVRGFDDGLSIGEGINNNHQSWLLIISGLVVGKDTRSPSGVGSSLATGVVSEFDYGSLSKLSWRNDLRDKTIV